MHDFNISIPQAMNRFYTSLVFEKLLDYKTGLYQESAGYIYDIFKTEQEYGRIVQLEI
jgi:hypothetical protein